ncbi:MAG: family 78 glycoside hydrolase catalytic domain [Bacteroidales bacterium]|nr:family 78 glycoside hydrolase catalytic domain [Bacteroidales bacterium]
MKAMRFFLMSSAVAVMTFMAASCSTTPVGEVGTKIPALDDSAWNASTWISVADAPVITGKIENGNRRAADGANWFMTTVKNDKKVTSAKWMTAGLGTYDLYVNGNLIGKEFLKPGFTHYAKTKRSYTYDITDAYKTSAGGQNVLSAQVTPGWWADKIVTPGGNDGMIGKKCAFRGVLELTFADGTKKLYGTDLENWKAGIAGPIKHAAIFDGEEYDARIPQGFETPEKFSAPEENSEFQGDILPSEGAEIYMREDIALSPVKAYVWKDIEGASEEEYGKVVITKEFAPGEEMVIHQGETLVVDFGQNAAAVPSFVFKAKEGTVLTCLPSELLNDGNGAKSRGMDGPEGSCHRTNLRIADWGIRLDYTFADSKDFVCYRPTHTFFGYRLISVTATDEVTIKSVESIPVTSIAEEIETGKITTGNDLINKLISNTVWGQRSNYLSVPTDCPQRDERLGWTADTQVFTETGTFFANTDNFFHKWMRDMRDTQNEFGAFPGVAPLAQYGAEKTSMMRLGWADAGIIVPWTVWKQFGDKSIIDENWEAIDRFMNHINDTKYDHKTLSAENGNYQWADWLSYEPLESNGGGAFTRDKDGKRIPLPDTYVYWNYLSASYWAIDAGMMRDMAAATGRDAAKYQAMEDAARAYLKATFLDGKGGFKTPILNTMQTPAIFALKNHLVEGAAKDNLIARLRQNFVDHGNCLQTGFLGTSILMGTLTDNGMVDIAYELLFQRKNPSWLYSIDNGATTIWERWNSYTLESGMGPKGMNSFNHYAYGAVCEWIWETAAGIAADPAQPGFKHIIMKPVPDKRLGHLDAEYNSAAGLIKSSWKYEGDKWIWEFTVPEGATATVTLPGETESKDYTAGTYKIEK